MDYNNLSKEQLIRTIEELQMLNHQLLKEKDQEIRLEYAWSGNLGHWYWNVKTNSVTFNPLKVTTLGYSLAEIPDPVTYQFFTEKLHPDDYQTVMDTMLAHLQGIEAVYEVEYRIRTKDGRYKWYYDRGKITQYDQDGKPLFLAGIVFDITERKEMQQELEYKNRILAEQSSTDGLTKVKNHRSLIEHLKQVMLAARLSHDPLSLAMIDLDDFKKVNDSKGHLYGDKVLTDIAAIMEKGIRTTDLVGRYGGEEFMIVLSKTSLADAVIVLERIRQTIEQHGFDGGIQVTISCGVKELGEEDLSEFIHGADLCLYEAKKLGKNRVVA